MPGMKVVHWNPRSKSLPGRVGSHLKYGPRHNNFGDLIGPIVVQGMLSSLGLRPSKVPSGRILAVGSIMHFAQSGDTIWGAGVNGKVAERHYKFRSLDVRAVRGPLTQKFLWERGITVPSVFGDPALLIPQFYPELLEIAQTPDLGTLLVPNFNDAKAAPREWSSENSLDPTSEVFSCLKRIARSDFVVASSLHAIVIAEALGKASRLVASPSESTFKYDDYYLGTGRAPKQPAASVEEALAEGPIANDLNFDPVLLMNSFPTDKWRRQAEA